MKYGEKQLAGLDSSSAFSARLWNKTGEVIPGLAEQF